MVAWAKGGYAGQVRLLMLCVETGNEGLRTSKWFGQEFEVPSTVINGYIDKQSEVG